MDLNYYTFSYEYTAFWAYLKFNKTIMKCNLSQSLLTLLTSNILNGIECWLLSQQITCIKFSQAW